MYTGCSNGNAGIVLCKVWTEQPASQATAGAYIASYNIPRSAYMRGPPSAEGRGARARAGCGAPPPGPAPGSGDPRSLITSRFRLGHNTLRKTQTYTI